MDYARYEGTDLTITAFVNQHLDIGAKKALEKLKRFGEKKALFCPFCNDNLILRVGEMREVHFAHIKGRTCLTSSTYDNYLVQTQREGKQHSAIRDLIYDVLKNQEKINKELRVEFGYVAKAKEQWKLVPDICLQTGSREIAINIITNVNDIGDRKTLRQFIKRNHFFRENGMDVVWFVEDRELADDMENRIVHLWEAEYNLTIKTEQDEVWDALLYELDSEDPKRVYEVMGYKAKKNLDIDVRSLYYVHSLEDEIQFSVHRVMLDDKLSPFRAFAVNHGYRMSLSTALTISDTIQLSHPEQDELDRATFKDEYEKRKQVTNEQDTINLATSESSAPHPNYPDVYESSVDPVALAKKLRGYSINEKEAYQLYGFVRKYSSSLEDYGLTYASIKNLTKQALGAIHDPKIRTWLVELLDL